MRLAMSLLVLGLWSATATAQGLPKVGDTLVLTGAADWPKLQWSYTTPSTNDAAGKIVIHWFCTPKVSTCVDELARIVTLRDAGGVYIVAYINSTQRESKKLDPIRESEGVGRGTVAFGAGVKKLFKQFGLAKGPASVVVDVDGKVKLVTTTGDINELDSRDAMIKTLVEAVKPYKVTNEGPSIVKVGERLTFTLKVQLASWLAFGTKPPMEFNLTAPKDLKCDATQLKADRLKVDGKTLAATVSCAGPPKGVYEVRGEVRFGYENLDRTTGLGSEGASWKFEVRQP